MADPLSIAASVAGLITLAASTAKLVKTVGDRYTNQVSGSVQENVQTLEAALGNITKGMWTSDFTRPGEKSLQQPISSCAQTLRELGKNFRKLHPQAPSGTSVQRSWDSLRRLQQKMTRPETLKEIERLQVVLESQKATLLLAMQTCSGASQFDMLVMIFNTVQELRLSKQWTQPAHVPTGHQFHDYYFDDELLNEPSVAQTFSSFEDWLETWSAPEADQGVLKQLTSENPLNALSPHLSSASQTRCSTVKLVIEGLKKHEFSEETTKEIIAPRDAPLYEIISLLNSQEYEYTCGFMDVVDGTSFAPFLPWNTSLVAITDGHSSYDVETGLRINRNERLIDFYNGCLRNTVNLHGSASPSIEKRASALAVQDTFDPRINTSITFQRTLRLPEDGESHGTSALLGPFPLFNAEEHASRLPSAMKSKGGFFFPMFQREALAIVFSHSNDSEHVVGRLQSDKDHFATKMYAGSINCLSGKTASETNDDDDDERTDYIVSPRQLRLDGYRSADGTVRQFVAMPLGWGYSAEHQITGLEFIGGVQLRIASRLRDRVEFRRLDDLWDFGNALRITSTATNLGLGVGDVLAMTDFDPDIKILDDSGLGFADKTNWSRQPLLMPTDGKNHRMSTVQDMMLKSGQRARESTDGIRLRVVPPVLVHLKIIMGERAPIEESFRCSPHHDLGSLVTHRLHRRYLDCGHCDKCRSSHRYNAYPEWSLHVELSASVSRLGWPARHCPLETLAASYGRADGELRIVCTQISPGLLRPRDDDTRLHRQSAASAWEMALGAGARLMRRIYMGASHQHWDWRNSRLVNVQILNAVAFRSVTGIPAWTPVSLRDYEKRQLTLEVPLSVPQGHSDMVSESAMTELLNISSLDREVSDKVRGKRLMVLCPQCETNMCNLAHLFCSDCTSNSSTYFQCGKEWTEKITLSGVMEHPSKGHPPDGKSSRLLSFEETCEQLEAIPHYPKSGPHSGTAEDVAKKIAHMQLGEQGIFWYNSVISILKKAETQTRRSVTKSLILSNTETGHTQRLELLLGLVSPEDYAVQETGAEIGLKELLRVSVDNVRVPDNDRHLGARKPSTCLEAVVDWMARNGIEAHRLADWGFDTKALLCPQSDQSLRRVIDFLIGDSGRSLSEDYGVTVFFMSRFCSSRADRELRHTLLRTLVAHGVDVDARDHLGRTMLWRDSATDLGSVLLDCGARVDVLDNGGNAVLHHLVSQARHPTTAAAAAAAVATKAVKARVAEILRHKAGRAGVDTPNAEGLTALHLAMGIDSLWDWMGFTGLLVGGGADAELPMQRGVYRDEVGRLVAKWEGELERSDVLMRKSAERRLQTVRRALGASPTE
ncbi:Integral membrane protein [Colletotrichum higginsianum IMI 349063]|uniref:Integral membrane protein n=1 Tax=Colletotrichum higginsianum (strain IMI 349063) TaxID=759273 RepID=A0A1B7YCV9_COLHI|nr:Integral membrane protein [Colletotrichum higginsianum IMI 349063]OBR09963.1 Integral membrane protein [Colletotrichum higginsianum IMI 349063]